MRGLVVGIDPSSDKMAIAVGTCTDDVQLMQYKYRSGPDHRPEVLAQMHATFSFFIQNQPNIIRIGIEMPTVTKSGPGSTIPQAMANGAVVAALGMLNPLPVIDQVPIPSWKSGITGNGSAPKDLIADWVRVNYPRVFDLCVDEKDKFSQDLCDAFCIFLYELRYEKIVKQIERKRASL